jgi:hypothetical protein
LFDEITIKNKLRDNMAFKSVEKFVKKELIDLMNEWDITLDDVHQILDDIKHERTYSKDREWIILDNEPVKQYWGSGDMQQYQVAVKHPSAIDEVKVITIYEKDKLKFYTYLQDLKMNGFNHRDVITHVRRENDELILEFLRPLKKNSY